MHIRDWPSNERPRERLLARGAAPQQVAAPTVTQVPAVQLRIGLDSP